MSDESWKDESWANLKIGFMYSGTDGDTVRMILDPLVGLLLVLRTKDGRTFDDVRCEGFRQAEEDPYPMFLQFFPCDRNGEVVGEIKELQFEDIEFVGVY